MGPWFCQRSRGSQGVRNVKRLGSLMGGPTCFACVVGDCKANSRPATCWGCWLQGCMQLVNDLEICGGPAGSSICNTRGPPAWLAVLPTTCFAHNLGWPLGILRGIYPSHGWRRLQCRHTHTHTHWRVVMVLEIFLGQISLTGLSLYKGVTHALSLLDIL